MHPSSTTPPSRTTSAAASRSSRRRCSTPRSSPDSTSCRTSRTRCTSAATREDERRRSRGRAPDLKVKNSTPYGILLWPTYDATTLTVHMYSTHYVDVTAGATHGCEERRVHAGHDARACARTSTGTSPTTRCPRSTNRPTACAADRPRPTFRRALPTSRVGRARQFEQGERTERACASSGARQWRRWPSRCGSSTA